VVENVILLTSLTALAAAQASPTSVAPAQPEQGAELRELLQDCSAHRFEAVVSAMVEGELKRSRMRLCGTKGQSDSDWLVTLKDSAAKIAANSEIAKPMRDEMVKALETEIALRSAVPGSAIGSAPAKEFTLKPRAVAPGASSGGATAGYTSLPPLPPPVSVAKEAREIATLPYVPPPPVERPDLKFKCFSATSVGEGECLDFDRFMVLVITASSSLQPGASLRFLRDGEKRAEVALGAMRKGQKLRLTLPSEVCKGVNGGELKIETWVLPKGGKPAPQLANSDGPYSLRCL
jgi:hypothetical protein